MSTSRTLLRTAGQVTAWTLATAWVLKALSVARNLSRVPNLAAAPYDRAPRGSGSLAVIVPARNEEEGVTACLESLMRQELPGLYLVAVDDRSTDATGRQLDAAAALQPGRLSVLHVSHLPPGWLGKTHAMHVGAEFALAESHPDWLLFTDADVLFHPDVLRRALAFAEQQQADHLVVLPSPTLHSAGEAIFLGYLQIIGFWALRPWRVPQPHSRDAIGVGAFNLLRSSAYSRLGGMESLRLQIVEDLALGRRVKRLGLRQRVAFAPGYIRLHWAVGIRGILRTMTKNLFALYCYNVPIMLLSSGGLVVLCLGPYAGLLSRRTRLPSSVAVAAIFALYGTAAPLTGAPRWSALGFPVGAVLLLAGILRSSLFALRLQGVEWRGTVYPLKALRKDADCVVGLSLQSKARP